MKNFYTPGLLSFMMLFVHMNEYAQCPSISLTGGTCPGSDITASLPFVPSSLLWKKDGALIKVETPAWNPLATTIAGGNGSGSDDNQIGSSSIGILVDAQGNVYISDPNNSRIQKWAPGATSGVTIAGGNGFGSDANQLSSPDGICLDAQGNLYIADNDNNRVQKWAPGATEGVTVAGGNGQGAAANQLNYPLYVQVDAAGNLYVLDNVYQNYGHGRVTKWVPGATEGILVAGGNTGGGFSDLDFPNGMYVDNAGNVYVLRGNSGDVIKWAPGVSAGVRILWTKCFGLSRDSAGYFYTSRYDDSYQVVRFKEGDAEVTPLVTPSTGSGPDQISSAGENCVDASGNIYLRDPGNYRVQRFSPTSVNTTLTSRISGDYSTEAVFFDGCSATSNVVTTVQLPIPNVTKADLCLGSSTVLSVNGSNVTWNPGGQTGSSITVAPVATTTYTVTDNSSQCSANVTVYVDSLISGTISGPQCLGTGNLTINSAYAPLKVDWKLNDSVVKTSYATYSTLNAIAVAGNNGPGSSLSQLQNPQSICFDSQGNLYVVDEGNFRVLKFAPGSTEGVVVAGGHGFGSALNQFAHPTDVCVDKAGNVYVADEQNLRVLKFAPGADNGVIVAGGHNRSELLSFVDPWGLFMDDAGNLYITDVLLNRVTKWAPYDTAGVVVAGGNGSGSATNQLNFPEDLTVDAAGNIYICDNQNHRVQKWAPGASSGITVASGPNNADFAHNVAGITLDGLGNMYIVGGNGNISRWAPGATSGTYLAGNCCTGTGALSNGATVCLDKKGNLYAVGFSNNVVWKYPADNFTLTPSIKSSYSAVMTSFAGCTSNADAFHFAPAPGDTAVFGNNIWNVYAFNAGGSSNTGQSWNTAYTGYYTDSALNFDTRNKWDQNSSPSSAPGYQGCAVNADNHSWSAKRQGFPCGYYHISIPGHDDEAELFIDGVQVWGNGCCGANTDVWEGALNDSSKVVFRGTEGGGQSYGAISFVASDPPVTVNGPANICPGYSVDITAPDGSNYLWNTNETAQTIRVSQTGNYSVTYTAPGGCTQTASQQITVQPIPKPELYTYSLDLCGQGQTYLYLNNWDDNLTYTVNSDSVANNGSYFTTYHPGSYTVTGTDALGCSTGPSDPVIITEAPGSPEDFGNNVWNVYAFDNGALNYTGFYEPWKHYVYDSLYNVTADAYRGYYTDSSLSFNTQNEWSPDGVPSDAPGFQGCGLLYYNDWIFSWSAKRRGFPCGHYQVNIPAHDDNAELWIDGTRVWQEDGVGAGADNVWQGVLGPASTIEFRVNNYGGACYGSVEVVLIDTSNIVDKPVIKPAGPVTICQGSYATFTSSAITGNTWSTGDTTQSISVSAAGTYYVTVNKEGCTAQSNSVQVTVKQPKTWYADADSDGYGNSAVSILACAKPAGYVSKAGDCDDNNPAVHPGAKEICGNGVDDNCNGQIDENCIPIGIKILNDSVIEGNKGQGNISFIVRLSKKPKDTVRVDYATHDGTATAGSDYIAKSGTLAFAAGITVQKVIITVLKDKIVEPDETFYVVLSNPVNGSITNDTATGTIINDDGNALTGQSPPLAANTEISTLVKLAPNPAADKVYVSLEGYSGLVTINLMSLEGKLLLQKKVQNVSTKFAQYSIDVSRFASGIYMIMVIDEQGRRRAEKLIVQR